MFPLKSTEEATAEILNRSNEQPPAPGPIKPTEPANQDELLLIYYLVKLLDASNGIRSTLGMHTHGGAVRRQYFYDLSDLLYEIQVITKQAIDLTEEICEEETPA